MLLHDPFCHCKIFARHKTTLNGDYEWLHLPADTTWARMSGKLLAEYIEKEVSICLRPQGEYCYTVSGAVLIFIHGSISEEGELSGIKQPVIPLAWASGSTAQRSQDPTLNKPHVWLRNLTNTATYCRVQLY